MDEVEDKDEDKDEDQGEGKVLRWDAIVHKAGRWSLAACLFHEPKTVVACCCCRRRHIAVLRYHLNP